VISAFREAIYFSDKDWTSESALKWLVKSVFRRTAIQDDLSRIGKRMIN
jgi:hypothetical protein